jgi:hypothetical protein
MYIAWQHNPQCEFHCEGIINWSNWLAVGSAWFVAGFVLIFVVSALLRSIINVIGHRSENT